MLKLITKLEKRIIQGSTVLPRKETRTKELPKIRFQKSESDFYKKLAAAVQASLTPDRLVRANRLLYLKLGFYLNLFLGFYGLLYTELAAQHYLIFCGGYLGFGLSGILLAFNASHDAVHNTLFSSRKLNELCHYLIFNLQGVNASLWKKRHISSHHIFPNVEGCDADIDDNPFIRLSEAHPRRRFQQFQHLYAPLLYAFYTLHWILIKDFVYLRKKRVANMVNLSYSKAFIAETLLLKLLYFVYTLVLPIYFTPYGWGEVLLAFLFTHFCISIFFVFTLIISHLTLETAFPEANEKGLLPFDYYEHQLAVAMDYHPTSRVANWVFGGFNAHAAHHLFPHLPHTLYPHITPYIQSYARQYQLPYYQLSMPRAIYSHFRYLKKLGQVNSEPCLS